MGRGKKKDSRRKAPLGQGRSARSERKKKKRAQQELQAQLGHLHLAKKKKLQQAGIATDKSTGFAKSLTGSALKEENLPPIKRIFWLGSRPEGEPDEALKMTRKSLGIKVRGSPVPAPVESFFTDSLPSAFSLFFRGVRGRKCSKPTLIQMQVWPAALCGLDVMGIAPTGSGKTLAYLLPAVVHLAGQSEKENLSPAALVLLPTRELASQVSDQFNGKGGLRQVLNVRCAAIYGGVGKDVQVDQILTGGCPEVVSATPGRLLDLLGLAALSLDSVSFLVLDEADKMLQLGFEEQLDAVAKAVRRDRQCLLFSATFPERLRQAAERWMTSTEKVVIRVGSVSIGAPERERGSKMEENAAEDAPRSTAAPASAGATLDAGADGEDRARHHNSSTLTVSGTIRQLVHVCAEHKKNRKLVRFLDQIRHEEKEEGVRQRALVIIFCNKIQKLKTVASFLRKQNHYCEPLHSGIPQAKRENALNMFKAGRLPVLVATDVAARGLHVKHLRYVVNYDFPSNLEQYCHRIGRTGRDGESGTAFSFFTRNLAPLSRDLVELLERSGQQVDPNLRELAEGKASMQGEEESEEKEDTNEKVEDDVFAMAGMATGGGLRIVPRGNLDEVSSSDEVLEAPGDPTAQSARKARAAHGGQHKKIQSKVKRPRGKRGGAKNK